MFGPSDSSYDCYYDCVACAPPSTGSDGASDADLIRLVANSGGAGYGAAIAQGRLEVYRSGSWGTVCDDSFGYQVSMDGSRTDEHD